MEKIPSFTIDHIRLLRGIYVSRKDYVGTETITTFDVRMKEPNREPALSPSAIHTIEHLAATFLRNHPVWADKIIYWGPMGCLTGNYLVVKNYLMMNLPMAKWEAKKYLEEVLEQATDENLNYPA